MGTTPKLLKIKIPLIVTADGKWSTMASHRDGDGEYDWSWIEENVDYDDPPVMLQRYLVEAVVEIPETKETSGTAIPEAVKAK